jgi:hypothetical protein
MDFSKLKQLLSKPSDDSSDQDLRTSIEAARQVVHNPEYVRSPEEEAAEMRFADGMLGAVAGSTVPVVGGGRPSIGLFQKLKNKLGMQQAGSKEILNAASTIPDEAIAAQRYNTDLLKQRRLLDQTRSTKIKK